MNFSNSAYRPMTERWQPPEYEGSEGERLAKAKRLDGQLAQIAAEHKSVSIACSFPIEENILLKKNTSVLHNNPYAKMGGILPTKNKQKAIKRDMPSEGKKKGIDLFLALGTLSFFTNPSLGRKTTFHILLERL